MSRTVIALAALSGLLAGGLATSLVLRPLPGMNADAVRQIVKQELVVDAAAKAGQTAKAQSPTQIAELGPVIESYLMANPELLQKMSEKLQAQAQAAEKDRTKTAIAGIHDQIFNDPDAVVVGNPDGDVTLVEYFDYNCTYCRAALPDMMNLLASDPNLRIVLKEFPILSQGSLDAARVALAVSQAGGDYMAFHAKLFETNGQIGKKEALDAAAAVGLDPVKIEQASQDKGIADIIQRSYAQAQALNITGTPSYVIGDTIIPGAVGEAQLKSMIKNLRDCGATSCES